MKEQREKIIELFKSNVTDENALEFVSEMLEYSKGEGPITSDNLAEAFCDLIFDPLDNDGI